MFFRGRRTSERGQGLVEFAVVFPLLVFFLFAVFEVGVGLNRQATLQGAVREGARSGALVDDNGVVATARTVAPSQTLLTSSNISVCYENLSSSEEGVAVNVTATYHFRPKMLDAVLNLFGSSIATDIPIKVTGSSRMERAVKNSTISASCPQ